MNKSSQSWLSTNILTRLVASTILAISVIMSATIFVILLRFQNNLTYADFRFSRDFSLILAHSVLPLVNHNDFAQLRSFIEHIYLNESSVCYIQLLNLHGDMVFSFPVHYEFLSHLSSFQDDIFQDKYYNLIPLNFPIVKTSVNSYYNIIDSLVPLIDDNHTLGFLRIGLNSSFNILTAYSTIQKISVAVFVSVSLIFILGISFNFFSLLEPYRLLLIGLKSIAEGNFNYKIIYPFDNQLGNLIIIFNQMSERLRCYEKKNVAQLISEKAKLETLVSTISDGAILLDTELRLLFINQVAVKVFHWSSKDLIGQAISTHLPIHVNDALLPILNGMVKSNCFDNTISSTQEVIIDLRYESLKTFRFLLSTVLTQSDKVLAGVIVTIQDITREAQLNAAKNQFIGNVSHELRTPLCNIGSFLETLIDYRHKLNFEQTNQFLSIAHAETKRLNRLVNDVLDLSRLEAEYAYLLKPLSLNKVISYIVQSSQIVALNKNVQIIVEISSHVKKVLAHESSLCQVLSNLISNSLKFTHTGGQIVIRVYPLIAKNSFTINKINSQITRVEIIDNGIGIDKMFQKQIFDRFMRIENNVHTLEGTGLGLSIVKNIIEKHNSVISVYSEVAVGTSFWFDLFIEDSNFI